MGSPQPPPLHRLRPGHWVAIDVAASVLLAFATSLDWGPPSVLHLHDPRGTVTVAMAGALIAGGRRLRPRTVVAVLAIGWAAATALGRSPGAAVPVAFAVYLMPLRLPVRQARQWLAGALGVTVLGPVLHLLAPRGGPSPGVSALVRDLLLITLAWAAGFAVWQQRAFAAGLREQAARKVREELADFRRMVNEERLEIARELHDVLAHSMGLIAVQAGVANYVVAERPEEAARALSSIEEISRGALREARAMLGTLRSWDHRAGDAHRADGLLPAPRLAQLDGLLERARAAGVQVELDVRGPERPLPVGIDLAAYRVVQEALTNVMKHASTGGCRVTITYDEAAVTLEITDAGAGAPDSSRSAGSGVGHGIIGMRERVAMYGGALLAGPATDGGFRVQARFPLGGVDV